MSPPISNSPPDNQEYVLVNTPDGRKWYVSKGVMGAFGSLIAWLLLMFGIDVASADIETVTLAGITIVGAVSSVVAIIGRLTARNRIS